jgi:opacity protein-like surface antigen
MKRFLLILLAIALVASVTYAGDNAAPKTGKGDKAWMFTFNGLSNVGAGNYMAGAGLKYYIQDNWGLRVGVSFSGQSIPNVSENPLDFGVNAGVEYVYSTLGSTAAYVGGQAMFQSSKAAGSSNTATTFGVAAIAGVNWFMWENVSLQPEYQLGFTSSSPGGGGSSTTTYGLSSTGSFTISWFF